MKAVYIEAYGDASVMKFSKDHPIPKIINKDDILIQIYAASINPIDWKLRDGMTKLLMPYSFPIILGHDISGVVTDVAEGVTKFKKGDEVFCRLADGRIGAYAEYCVSKESFVAHKPKNISFVEAASLPLVGMTVMDSFEGANLPKDTKVLITGGPGGVGTFGIQYATNVLNLHVITTASEKKIDLCKSLGAKEVINYKTHDFSHELKGLDFAFDTTGESGKMFSSVIKSGGKIRSIVGIPNSDVSEEKKKEGFAVATGVGTILDIMQAKVNFLSWWYGIDYNCVFLKPDGKKLAAIGKWVEDGKIKAVVDKVFELEDYAEAFKYAEYGKATGKVCIQIKK
jgi:alcohol dehydrogenase